MKRVVLVACVATAAAAQPAFEGALGFGAVATGGRGGRVLHVTTLAASGPGSFAEAARASGPRYIVFDVSGVIVGDVELANGDVTIAGQTAPGAGITLNGHLFTPYDRGVGNLVVRFLRVRPPPPNGTWPASQHDAIQMSDVTRAIFDHVDVSHGVDELVDHWLGGRDVTWQNSLLSFPNPSGGHPEGAHPYCLIAHDGDTGTGGGRVSVVNNLFAHCRVRTPALSIGPAEAVNNVVFDGREGFVHHNVARGDFRIAGNTYVDGPSANLVPFWFDADNDPAPTRYFMGDNRVLHPGTFEGLVENPWTTPNFANEYTFAPSHITQAQFFGLDATPAAFGGTGYGAFTRAPVDAAYARVLDCAGAWPRDHVATTAVAETRARSGTQRNLPLGDLLSGLTPGAAPLDTDRDGMPDAWETQRGLDPMTDDHSAPLGAWPALEVYLDELAASLAPCGASLPPVDAGVLVPDAGIVDAGRPDAGTVDAGAVAPVADAGVMTADAGADGHEPVGGGCGCGAAPTGLLLSGLWGLARRRRARSLPVARG